MVTRVALDWRVYFSTNVLEAQLTEPGLGTCFSGYDANAAPPRSRSTEMV